MKSEKRHIGWLLGSMLMLLMLVACADESSNEPQGNALRLLSVTRTSSPFAPTENNSIKMFITTKDDEWSVGQFNRKDNEWANDNLSVKENNQYYIYGFMPNDNSLVSGYQLAKPANKDFSDGADLTLQDLPIFTDKDICVIVGVQRVTNTTATTEAVEGNYGYLSGLASENYVNLLMAHLYSQLILQFNVDATYYALRHIKLKEVTLKTTYGEKINVTIPLTTGNGLITSKMIFGKNTDAGDSKELTMLALSAPEKELSTTATEIGTINCAPCIFDANGTYLTLTCKYDVYNTDETKVLRAGCEATNKLKLSGMNSGVQRTVTLTVAPTYLYVLSDDDLNNPTITVN